MKQPFIQLLTLLVFFSFLCLGERGNRIQGKTNKVKYNSKWWENGRKSYGSCSAKPSETKDCRVADDPTSSGIASEWQEWGGWSECSSSCGRGLKIRARACNGSQRSCQGESAETKECFVTVCPGYSLCILLYSFFTLFQDLSSQVSGKNGMNGPSAPAHVARGWKSGLELAAEDKAHVKESPQKPKTALWLSVQVSTAQFSVHCNSEYKFHFEQSLPIPVMWRKC